jgi:hypothetical protein
VKQVARQLGVRYVLEGSVRKAGNRVRIGGQLIDTTSGAHIWADRFDGELDDIFALLDQVASSVSARSSHGSAALRSSEQLGSRPNAWTPTICICARLRNFTSTQERAHKKRLSCSNGRLL